MNIRDTEHSPKARPGNKNAQIGTEPRTAKVELRVTPAQKRALTRHAADKGGVSKFAMGLLAENVPGFRD